MTEHPSHKVRLALVEDNEGDVELLRWAFRKAGMNYDLTVLSDGAAALEFIRRQRGAVLSGQLDLMILDLNLPKASGGEILAAMRSDPVFANVPVVILTSSDAPGDRSKLEALKIRRYFVKPPDLRTLLNLGESIRDILTDLAAHAPVPAM